MKRPTKLIALIMALAMVALCFAACSSSAQTTASSASTAPSSSAAASSSAASSSSTASDSSNKKFKIGVTMQGLDTPTIVDMKNYIEDEFKTNYPNAEYTIMDGQRDNAKQLQQVETFISQKVDAIILNPVDASGVMPGVQKAHDAGIPVITLLQEAQDPSLVTAHSGMDHKQSEILSFTYGLDLINNKGNTALIMGPMGQSAQIQRTAGYEELLAKNPNVTSVAKECANWQRDQALALAENWIQAGKKIDLFVVQSDNMAMGVVQALEESKLKTPVVSIDGDTDALQAVKDGRLACTVVLPLKPMSIQAVKTAMDIVQGKEYNKDYRVDLELVNKDNVDNYIKK